MAQQDYQRRTIFKIEGERKAEIIELDNVIGCVNLTYELEDGYLLQHFKITSFQFLWQNNSSNILDCAFQMIFLKIFSHSNSTSKQQNLVQNFSNFT